MHLLLGFCTSFFRQLKIDEKKKLQGFRDAVPNVIRFLYEVEKRLSAPSKIWMEVLARFTRTTLTKLRHLDGNILLSFFEN